MKKKRTLIIVGIVLALIAVIAVVMILVFGKEKYRVIKVKSYDGTVTYERNGKSKDIVKDMNLSSGDTVTTGSDSNLELLADSDKHIVAEADTCFSIKATGNEKSGKIKVEMLYGTALYTIDNKLGDKQKFEVSTPNAVFSVRGTIFKIHYDRDADQTTIDVIEGTVHVEAGDQVTDLNMGESAIVMDDEIQPINSLGGQNAGTGGDDVLDSTKAAIRDANVGDTISFGNYTSTRGVVNYVGPIEWYVLEKTDGQALLMSVSALEGHPYHTVKEDVTWENCSLRAWLNDEFFYEAFSEAEQKIIVPTTLNNQYTTEKGNVIGCGETVDKVWLLSLDEAKTIKEEHRELFHLDGFWWLRSSGRFSYDNAVSVDSGDSIASEGISVEIEAIWVRPVIKVEY